MAKDTRATIKIPRRVFQDLQERAGDRYSTPGRLALQAILEWIEANPASRAGSSAKIVPDRVTMPTRSEPTVEYDEFNQEPRQW